ncbi:MAG: hypothetical protein BWK75_01340 [Candidatus Altiarchaeales archaeon A3]|nr:MAG: hypothetical protein BWK75_01340 [Candidatus Altiarchaeales archaeon A3]
MSAIIFSAKIDDLKVMAENDLKNAKLLPIVWNIVSTLAEKAEPQKSYTVIFDNDESGYLCLRCARKISGNGNGSTFETYQKEWDSSQFCSECMCLLEYELTEEGAKSELDRFLDEGGKIDLNSARQCYKIERVFRAYFPKLISKKKPRFEKPRFKDLTNLYKLCNKINLLRNDIFNL